MKRAWSIFTLLGGALLLAFLLLASSLLYIQYQASRAIIQHEVEGYFEQRHSLLQSVLNAQLDHNFSLLTHLAQQLRLPHPDSFMEYRDQLEILASEQRIDGYDLLLLASADGTRCVDYSPALLRGSDDCAALTRQYDSELQRWHLFTRGEESPPRIGLFAREPLVTSSGRVMGYLYGGIELTGNLALVNQAHQLAPSSGGDLGIAFGDQLLVSTAPPASAEAQTLRRLLAEPQQNKHEGNQFTASSRAVHLPLDNPLELRFVALVSNAGAQHLLRQLINQSALALLLSILLAALIALLTVRLTLSPLSRLLALAQQASQGRDTDFSPGPVREFNQLSQTIADTVHDLKRSRQRLTRYSQDLESSNQRLSDSMQQNQSLLHQIIHLQEQERKHLAQELHDDLGQSLAVVRTDAYLIQQLVEADNPAYESAQSIYQNAQEMYDVVYRRIISLRPLPLNDLGLAEAIRFMPALESFAQHGIELTLTLPPTTEKLSEKQEINLYRIVQEGVTNILKHSQATRAWVWLRSDRDQIALDIGDNGVGIRSPLEPRMGYGFGLSGMMERTRALGGQLRLEAPGEGGTLLKVRIPRSKAPAVSPPTAV